MTEILPRTFMRPRLDAREFANELLLGAIYWAALLLALEPSNVMRAAGLGRPLAFAPEATRIVGASLLGAPSAPIAMVLARRFPIVGARRWRHGLLQAISVVGLTVILIVVSCVLVAEAGFGGSKDVPDQLLENGPLVAFCLAGLVAFTNGLEARRRQGDADPRVLRPAGFLRQITVKTRRGVVIVPMDTVDWIESQGNYVALHVGGATHLVRETSARLEQQLDPERFARIHRRTLVALSRIRELRALSGGDAELHLIDDTKLRLSRSYRGQVQSRLSGP